MKFAIVCFALCVSAATAQDYGGFYGGFDGLSGDFGGPSAFGGGIDSPVAPAGFAQLNSVRDGRGNTGPVVFPPGPPPGPETSGVVVGASGYGFVPPTGQSGYNHYRVFY